MTAGDDSTSRGTNRGRAIFSNGLADTGYSEIHETRPRNLQWQLRMNLVEGGTVAVDPAEQQPLSNVLFPGHGTFTIALLEGSAAGKAPNMSESIGCAAPSREAP